MIINIKTPSQYNYVQKTNILNIKYSETLTYFIMGFGEEQNQ